MKKMFLLAALGFVFNVPAKSQDTLFSTTVVRLYEAGFSTDLIIKEITARNNVKFGMMNADTLKFLNTVKLPPNVQTAMIKREGILGTFAGADASGVKSAAGGTDDNGGLTGLGFGIYTRSNNQYIQLQTTVLSSNRENSFLHNNISSFIPTKVTGVIIGAAAPVSMKGTDTLYFVLQNASGTLAGSSMLGATSPNDLVLMRLTPKKKTREITLSKGSIAGQPEINPRDAIPFTSEPISAGIFRVFVRGGLERGQYCFLPGSGMARVIMDKVYDFEVNN